MDTIRFEQKARLAASSSLILRSIGSTFAFQGRCEKRYTVLAKALFGSWSFAPRDRTLVSGARSESGRARTSIGFAPSSRR